MCGFDSHPGHCKHDNATLRSQWQCAARAIAEADELVLIGYSLPPSDIVVRSLLRTSLDGSLVLPVDVKLGRARVVRRADGCICSKADTV
jgi:hypothetical protein